MVLLTLSSSSLLLNASDESHKNVPSPASNKQSLDVAPMVLSTEEEKWKNLSQEIDALYKSIMDKTWNIEIEAGINLLEYNKHAEFALSRMEYDMVIALLLADIFRVGKEITASYDVFVLEHHSEYLSDKKRLLSMNKLMKKFRQTYIQLDEIFVMLLDIEGKKKVSNTGMMNALRMLIRDDKIIINSLNIQMEKLSLYIHHLENAKK
jgi:hypothetical protein